MFVIRTSAPRGPLIDVTQLRFSTSEMRQLGELSIKTLKNRATRGIGSGDTPMPALKPQYARRKGRRFGPAVRNLRGPGIGGHMLDNISVRSVSNTSFTIDLTSQAARVKAQRNQDRAPWWYFSPQDLAIIRAEAAEMWNQKWARALGSNRAA